MCLSCLSSLNELFRIVNGFIRGGITLDGLKSLINTSLNTLASQAKEKQNRLQPIPGTSPIEGPERTGGEVCRSTRGAAVLRCAVGKGSKRWWLEESLFFWVVF